MAATTATEPPAPVALAPPPGAPRYEHLDALRGLAALSVIVIHASAFVGTPDRESVVGVMIGRMSACVAVFFVLSGFLLYRPFVASRLGTARPVSFGRYARGRALRILPGYWVALTLTAVVWPGLNGVLTGDWWRYYTLLHGYQLDRTLSGIPPSWTLCVEIGFYVALPFVVLALAHRPPRIQYAAFAAAGLVSLLLRIGLVHEHSTLVMLQLLPGYLGWFGAGMALAVFSVARAGRPIGWVVRLPWAPWAIAVLAYVGACLVDLPPSHAAIDYSPAEELAEHVLYLVIAVALMLPPIFGAGESGPRRLLSVRAIAFIGLVSYGTYLWHWPILAGLRDAGLSGWWALGLGGLVASYVAGTLSYYLVEMPALRLKDGWPRPRRRVPAPVSAGAPPARSASGTG